MEWFEVEIRKGTGGGARVTGVRVGWFRAVAPALLAIACAAALVTMASRPALAGAARPLDAATPLRSDPHLLRVLTPRRGANLRARTVRVRARVRPGVKLLSARIGGHDVAQRFERTRGGHLLVATLRVGRVRGLHYGRDRLTLMVGKNRRGDSESVPFTILRRDPRLMRLRTPRRTARAVRLKLRLAHADARVSVSLNGRPVRLPGSANDDRQARMIDLSADEGLRHGRNALRVKAIDPRGGRVTVVKRKVMVTRTAPIAGAGFGRRVDLGRRVSLDASASEAARNPKSLRYHWRIVRAPRGSRAKLRRADTLHPRFRPDLPGHYRLRVTVTERMPTARRSGQAGKAAVAESLPTASASDTTTVAAAPDGTGLGVALDTIEELPGGAVGVKVGEHFYAPPEPADPLQLVVLDRKTLELRTDSSFPASTGGTAELAAAVSAAGSETLVIITTPTRGAYAAAEGHAALSNLNGAITAIGGAPLPADVAESSEYCDSGTGVCGSFSAVGTPGYPAGAGTVNPGLASRDGAGGDLRGYLELDQTGTLFSFVQEEHVHFDTTAPGTEPHTAVIDLGEEGSLGRYSSERLPGPETGAFVLVLDAGSLDFREAATFALQYTDVGTINTNLNRMAAMLEKYESDPSALVFIQSVGTMVRWESYEGNEELPKSWNRLATAIEKLGGQRTVFNSLAGPNQTYAQVGPGADPAGEWVKVASQAASRSAGELAGTLARNGDGQFYPENAGATPEYGDELTLLAYQPLEPWPLHETPGHVAAQRCVAEQLGISYPIESHYTDAVINWAGYQAQLDELTYKDLTGPSCENPEGEKPEFDEAEFRQVVQQLDKEFTDVPEVWKLIEKLKQPFLLQGTSSVLNIQMIGDNVEKAVAPPDTPLTYDPADITQELLYAIGALPGVGDASDVLELLAAGIGLVEATTLNAEGKPELETPKYVNADAFAAQLADEYKKAATHFSQIGEMLVGDWSKLQTVATNVLGPWAWSSAAESRALDGLNFASRRFAYVTLFPQAFGGLLRGTKGNSSLEIPSDTSRYPCWQYGSFNRHHTFYPFGKVAPYGGLDPLVEVGGPAMGGPRVEDWVFARPIAPNGGNSDEGNVIYSGFSPSLPSAELLRNMFIENAPETTIPVFQQLEFALAIRDQLRVLTVTHSSGESLSGPIYNLCEGTNGSWPW